MYVVCSFLWSIFNCRKMVWFVFSISIKFFFEPSRVSSWFPLQSAIFLQNNKKQRRGKEYGQGVSPGPCHLPFSGGVFHITSFHSASRANVVPLPLSRDGCLSVTCFFLISHLASPISSHFNNRGKNPVDKFEG